jgi:hypothetical protein
VKPSDMFLQRLLLRNGAWLRIRLLGTAAALLLLVSNDAFAAGPRVILLRGWFGLFSTGLDSIADQLKALGIEAKVAGHLNWSNEVAEILRNRSAGPLILVGHSQGANNVIDMAQSLAAYKVNVDLLIALSPFMQNPVPANVVKAIEIITKVLVGDSRLKRVRVFTGKSSIST